MLDIWTLRVAAAAVATCAFVLIFFGTYRTTKAPYAGWWSAVVGLAAVSAFFYLSFDTAWRVAAGYLGGAFGVAAGAAVWCASRSLRGAVSHRWWVAAAGLLMALAHAIESPVAASWPAGVSGPFLLALFVGMGAVEMFRLVRRRPDLEGHRIGSEAFGALVAIAIATSIVALFYVFRFITHVTVGPEHDVFLYVFGPAPTNISICVMMVVVTYSVALLSRFEMAQAWRLRAIHDDLTGLLTRDPFRERVEEYLAAPRRGDATMVLADFDHFKELNDSLGHAMGDRVLKAFGDACGNVLGEDDLACRWGGEEFVVFLNDGGLERAHDVAAELSKGVAGVMRKNDAPMTISYGIAPAPRGIAFDPLVDRADKALYLAKHGGRDQTAVYGQTRA